MLFKKNDDELTRKLEDLFSQDPTDSTDAKIFNLATELVEKNPSNYKAVYILAQCYHSEIGTKANYQKAVELYKILLKNENFDKNDVNFQYRFANALKKTNDNQCLIWYYYASCNGDQWSTYLLGSLLLNGSLISDIPYGDRYELAIDFLNRAIQMNAEKYITQQATEMLNLQAAKHKIRLSEIENQNKIFNLLKNNLSL